MAEKNKNETGKTFCVGCGTQIKFKTFSSDNIYLNNDEGILCRDCAAALLVKYPKRFERNPDYSPPNWFDPDNYTSPYLTVYPVCELTGEQVKQELATIDAYRERLRASFGGAENVFEVRLVHPLPKLKPLCVSISNAIRYKNAIAVYGYVRLGIFHKGDLAVLRHGDTTRDITVLLIQEGARPEEKDPLFSLRNPDSASCFYFERKGISEGLPAVMVLSPDAAGVQPGDLIVAD